MFHPCLVVVLFGTCAAYLALLIVALVCISYPSGRGLIQVGTLSHLQDEHVLQEANTCENLTEIIVYFLYQFSACLCLIVCANLEIIWNVHTIIGGSCITDVDCVCSVLWGAGCLYSLSPILYLLVVGLVLSTLFSVIPTA